MKKFIIKNKDKYKALKLAKGLDLQVFKTTPKEKKNLGVSTKKFGDKWFKTPSGKGIFKNYLPGEEIRIINELLYDNLAKQLGLNVAEYKPAYYGGYKGLLSLNIAKPNEKIKDGVDILDYNNSFGYNSFDDYSVLVKEYAEGEGLYVNMLEVKQNLFKMLVLDQLTFQEDRHEKNIVFLRNDKDNYLRIAPLIDNEMCFANDLFRLRSEEIPSKMGVKRFLSMHDEHIKFVANKEVNHTKEKYIENSKNIVELAKNNKLYANFLKKALTIDIDQAILVVENQGYEISEEYKTFVKDCLELSVSILKQCIFEQNKQNANSFKKEDCEYAK